MANENMVSITGTVVSMESGTTSAGNSFVTFEIQIADEKYPRKMRCFDQALLDKIEGLGIQRNSSVAATFVEIPRSEGGHYRNLHEISLAPAARSTGRAVPPAPAIDVTRNSIERQSTLKLATESAHLFVKPGVLMEGWLTQTENLFNALLAILRDEPRPPMVQVRKVKSAKEPLARDTRTDGEGPSVESLGQPDEQIELDDLDFDRA